MLVSQHVAFSTVAALVAAPLVRHKANLGLFLATAVGEDVDHYIWHALKFRDPSLRHAYRFFRSKYGLPPRGIKPSSVRFLHGPTQLVAISLAALWDRRLVPIALGVAFHGMLDMVNEYTVMPLLYERNRKRQRGKQEAQAARTGEAAAASRPLERSAASARR